VCDLLHGDTYRELAVVTSSGKLYLWSADPARLNSLGDRTDSVPALDMVFSDSVSSVDSSRTALDYLSVRYTQLPGRPVAMPTSINGRLYVPMDDTIVLCDGISARTPGGEPDSLATRTIALPSPATTHVAQIVGGSWAAGTADGAVVAADTGASNLRDTVALDDDSPVCGLAALAGEPGRLACAQQSGLLSVVDLASGPTDTARLYGIPPYAVVTGDLDNDAENEIVVTDSRHGVWCFNRHLTLAQGWERSPVDWASVYTYREKTTDTARRSRTSSANGGFIHSRRSTPWPSGSNPKNASSGALKYALRSASSSRGRPSRSHRRMVCGQ
jgi:hypothetical protein